MYIPIVWTFFKELTDGSAMIDNKTICQFLEEYSVDSPDINFLVDLTRLDILKDLKSFRSHVSNRMRILKSVSFAD